LAFILNKVSRNTTFGYGIKPVFVSPFERPIWVDVSVSGIAGSAKHRLIVLLSSKLFLQLHHLFKTHVRQFFADRSLNWKLKTYCFNEKLNKDFFLLTLSSSISSSLLAIFTIYCTFYKKYNNIL